MGFATDGGRERDLNEDTIIAETLSSEGANPWQIAAFLVVADGMGGHHGGEVASQLAGETARQIFLTDEAQGLTQADTTGTGLAQRVTESIQYINRVVYKHDVGHSGDTLRKPGTTLTMALVRAEEYCIGHVGDSRAYLIHEDRSRVTAEQLTVDDSLVAAAVRDGRLTPEQARTSPFRNHLSQAIGINSSVEPQVFSGPWQEGDTLLLCSDGLTEYLTEAELADFVTTHESIQAACDGLVTVANHRGGIDNISVVAARIRQRVATPVEQPMREADADADARATAPLRDAPLLDSLAVSNNAGRATVPIPSLANARTETQQDATTNSTPPRSVPPANRQATQEETIETMPKLNPNSAPRSNRLVGKKLSLVDRLMTPAGLATVAGVVIVSTVFGVVAGRHRNASNTVVAPTPAKAISAPPLVAASPAPTTQAANPGATVLVPTPGVPPVTLETFAPVSVWLDPDRKAVFVACKNSLINIRSGENKNRVMPDPNRPHRALVEFRHWATAYQQLQKGADELICRVRPIKTTPGTKWSGAPYHSQQDGQGHTKMTIPEADVRTDAEYSLQFGKAGATNGQELATFRVVKVVP